MSDLYLINWISCKNHIDVWLALFTFSTKRFVVDGIEDKKGRTQRRRVRVLYKVFKWSVEEDRKTVVEFNPWYASEDDPAKNWKQWDIFGGLFGQQTYLKPKGKNRPFATKNRDCRYCCCGFFPISAEKVEEN